VKVIAQLHPLGPLKNKQQLIKAFQKAAGELAEKAKQERKRDG